MFEFLSVKYAEYIIPAVAMTALGVAWMIGDSLWRAAHWRKRAEALQAQKDASKQDGGKP